MLWNIESVYLYSCEGGCPLRLTLVVPFVCVFDCFLQLSKRANGLRMGLVDARLSFPTRQLKLALSGPCSIGMTTGTGLSSQTKSGSERSSKGLASPGRAACGGGAAIPTQVACSWSCGFCGHGWRYHVCAILDSRLFCHQVRQGHSLRRRSSMAMKGGCNWTTPQPMQHRTHSPFFAITESRRSCSSQRTPQIWTQSRICGRSWRKTWRSIYSRICPPSRHMSPNFGSNWHLSGSRISHPQCQDAWKLLLLPTGAISSIDHPATSERLSVFCLFLSV